MTSLDTPVRTISPAATWNGAARVAGATTLALSGLLWAAADLIEPDLDGAASSAWTAAHPGQAGIALTADMLATPCLLGATAVWLLLSRRRSPRLAWAGAVLLVLGLTGQAMIAGVEMAAQMVARSGKIDAAAFSAALGDGPDGSLPGTVFTVMFFAGAFVGIVVMMAAVWRSRALPRAAAALLVAFQLTQLADPPFPSTLIAAAGLVWMAAALLRTPVADDSDGRGGVTERP
ncbi:hypothetical protein GCM10009530_66160 [Microbispora corallina]|uniref:DUF4386 family protein n=1 Tax=Microbispora corallina TaxID=83302 RepID=A0ABQ4G9G9_9ACTN|nr:hypothetical protein [Microbispora corallina]GIH43697.1 hypothetical protein Mco01_66970 [Microbispora corallina]